MTFTPFGGAIPAFAASAGPAGAAMGALLVGLLVVTALVILLADGREAS